MLRLELYTCLTLLEDGGQRGEHNNALYCKEDIVFLARIFMVFLCEFFEEYQAQSHGSLPSQG
jgi:hypothetical protein